MGKKIWKQKSVSNSGNNWVQVNNNTGSGKGGSQKLKDNLVLILKILVPLILVGVAVVLVLDWHGVIKLGIFPKQEEKE